LKNKANANKNNFTDSLLDHIQANIFLINVSQDGTFRFEKFNKAEENATGLTSDFLKGKTPVEVFGEEQGRKIEANYRRCLEEGHMISYEESLDLPTGKKTGLTKLSPVWSNGRIVQIVATSMDITAQKKEAERKLQESEQDFRMLFETMAQGVVYQDKTGTITAANPAAERILGLSLDQMQGRTSTDPNWKIIHEDGGAFLGEEHPAMVALKTGQPVFGVIMGVYHPLEEQYHWIKVNAIPQYHEGDDEPYQVYASFEDITEQIEAQQEIKKSKEQYFQLFDNIKSGVAIYQPVDNGEDFVYVDLNKAAERIDNFQKEDLIGKKVTELFPDARDYGLFEVLINVYQTGKSQEHLDNFYKDQRISGWRDIKVYKLPNGEIVTVFEDITERKQAEDKLRENEAKLSALFASMMEMIVLHEMVFDDTGKPVDYRITDCNPAFTNITGISREDALGKLATEIYDTPYPPYLDEYAQVVITGEPYRYETYFEPMNKHFDISVVSHSTNRFATITTDITAQKELEASLRAQKEELKAFNEEIEAMNEELIESTEKAQKANKAKSEFLSTMSHELRTPLNGVIGFSEVLKSTELNHDQLEYVDIVLYSAHHLLEIISDILDLSKIEAGKIELRPEKTSLRTLIEKILSLIRNNADQKGLKLTVDIQDNVPQTIEVDGPRLKQILLNLLSNAVKFTEEGDVKLSVNLLEQQNRQAKLLFKVTDTGIGIKEEDQGLIFEPFQQLDMSSSRKYSGTGLGVTITHNLLQKMGSILKLNSMYGKGSEFSFVLVLPGGEESEKKTSGQVKTEDRSNSPPFSNKTILVVEDNQINMRYADTVLSLFSKDIHVIKAKNGKEAYELYLKHQPDLILMDIIMPEIDGYQATTMIRDRDKQIPIVAMTAKAYSEDRDAFLKAGMNDFITKPVTLNQLKETLEKYLI